ncbi:MAG: nitrite reductase small subunit NirD [Rhodocyclaceae bacterium]|jgi:nitrite reductase (NADH) small subunit|nr:nitrite reductase small subunit NirD [Rhodocyclaceae bacterium]
MNWKQICTLGDIPRLGSRVVKTGKGDIAVFRTADDRIFALHDKCPHKGGALSQGMVAGTIVTCPMHSWKIQLENGEAVAPDVGCAKTVTVKLEDGAVWLAV